jgi:hypothetical protein
VRAIAWPSKCLQLDGLQPQLHQAFALLDSLSGGQVDLNLVSE